MPLIRDTTFLFDRALLHPLQSVTDEYSNLPAATRDTVRAADVFGDKSVFLAESGAEYTHGNVVVDTGETADKEYSTLATDSAPRELYGHPLVNNYVYDSLVLVVLASFCYLLYNYRSSVLQLIRDGLKDKILDNHTLLLKHFINYGALLCVLTNSLVAVKLADHFGLRVEQATGLPQWSIWFMPFALMVVQLLYMVYRRFVGRVIGRVINQELLFEQYNFLSRVCCAVGTLFITPLFLISALVTNKPIYWLVWVVLLLYIATYLAYIVRSYIYFRARNVNLFQWVLYIFVIEFFWLSFFVILALRDF